MTKTTKKLLKVLISTWSIVDDNKKETWSSSKHYYDLVHELIDLGKLDSLEVEFNELEKLRRTMARPKGQKR